MEKEKKENRVRNQKVKERINFILILNHKNRLRINTSWKILFRTLVCCIVNNCS